MAARMRVFIDGEAGTTGLGIRERLRALPEIERVAIAEDRRKETGARRDAYASADLVVLCLPDEAAKEAVGIIDGLGEAGPKVLDASTAHRVASGWVYGFAEMEPGHGERIAAARRVANPGCYPTGAVALLRPLVEAGLLPADHAVTVNAVSGYSGGGKAMIEAHERTGGPAFELYGLGLAHKHTAELRLWSKLTRRPIFVPSVGHFRQGMLVSVPLHLDTLPGRPSAANLHAALAECYRTAEQVRVLPPETSFRLEAEALNDTDLMELRVYANEAVAHALLVARLDNLGKGASGAAVQNIRLMLGLAAPAAREHAHA